MNHAPCSDTLTTLRKVSEITGINPVTLRAWERRYGLITPARTLLGNRTVSEVESHLFAGDIR